MLQEYLMREAAATRREYQTTQEDSGWDGECQVFYVDNSRLNSRSKGLRYRRARAFEHLDQQNKELALFGSTVNGVAEPCGEWLRVRDRFLPMKVQGIIVLLCQGPARPQDGEHEEDDEGRTQPRRMRFSDWEGSSPKASGAAGRATCAIPWVNDTQKPEEFAEPFFEPGTGALYEVVARRVAIRASASPAAPIQGCEYLGAAVELFDWDETRKWRQVQRPAECEAGKAAPTSWTLGWMMLDHEETGPLLRLKGVQFQESPLNPLCVAVHEDNLVDLQLFLLEGMQADSRGDDGRTPLMVAAERGRLDCCVLLLQARADPAEITPEGGTILDYAKVDSTRTLLRALWATLPGPAEDEVAVAFEALRAETRPAAERLLDEARGERAARSRRRALKAEEAERQRKDEEEAHHLAGAQRRAEAERSRLAARAHEARRAAQLQELERMERQAKLQRQKEESEAQAAAMEVQRLKKAEPLQSGLFEVVRPEGVAVHSQPSPGCKLLGREICGQIVELHEYDETGCWRRAVGHDFEGTLSGWAMIWDGDGDEWVVSCEA